MKQIRDLCRITVCRTRKTSPRISAVWWCAQKQRPDWLWSSLFSFLARIFLPGLWSQSLWKRRISPQQAPGSVVRSIGESRWQSWQRCRVSEAHLFRNNDTQAPLTHCQFCSTPCNCSSARWKWISNTLSQAHDYPWSTWDSHFIYCVLFPFPKEPFTPW